MRPSTLIGLLGALALLACPGAAQFTGAPLVDGMFQPADERQQDGRFGGLGPGDGAIRMPKIQWADSLEAAEIAAETAGRPLIAYFTFDACVWCKRLEQDTFADPAVIAASHRFVWVTLNRDHVPEEVAPFNVSAFPTLIVLGPEHEAIHRFQGYQKPEAFLENLDEGLRRWKLFRRGEQWDEPAPRAESVVDVGGLVVGIETFAAPSEGVPAGLVFLDDDLWIAQDDEEGGRRIHCIPGGAGEAQPARAIDLEHLITDITTDGERLYAISYDWTAGGPILAIDPDTGAIKREIRTEANKASRASGAKGLAWRKGRLWALDGGAGVLSELDLDTGEVLRTIQGPTWSTGLDYDVGADRFITAGRDHITLLDAETGEVASRIPSHYPLRSVATRGGAIYLMEQPVFGNDAQHQRIRLWPRQTVVHVVKLSGEAP